MPRKKKSEERFKVTEIRNPGGSFSWRLTGSTLDGKRIRQQYDSRAKAAQAKRDLDLEAEGLRSQSRLLETRLNESEMQDAETALKLIGDRSLTALAREMIDLERRARVHDLDVSDAMAFFERHYSPDLKEISIGMATERFLESRRDLRGKTKASYSTAMNQLLKESDPNTAVHEIKLPVLDKILSRYPNANTRKTYKRGWHTFFEWCLRRQHVQENPVKRLERIESDRSEIGILKTDEIQRLLTAAVKWKDGRFVPVFTLGLFAGLRPSEMEDLSPSDINGESILVKGGKLRRKHHRRVPIPPVLKEWLKAYPFKRVPSSLKANLKHLKKASGAKSWVQDIIRHTSISYQLERDQDEALTAFNNGTSKTMMDRHYRQVIETSEAVNKFWSLTPDQIRVLNLSVNLPERNDPTEWPSKRQLAAMILKKPVSHLAKELGVSDQAVRKHCFKLGLNPPERGYWQKKGAEKL